MSLESQYVINSNQGPILHHLATIHPWQTDRQTDGWQLTKKGRLADSPKWIFLY